MKTHLLPLSLVKMCEASALQSILVRFFLCEERIDKSP